MGKNARHNAILMIGVFSLLGVSQSTLAAGTVVRNTDGTGKVTITLSGIAVGTAIKGENTTDSKGPYRIGDVTGNGQHCIDISKGFVTIFSMDVGDTMRITAGTFSKDVTVTQGTLERSGNCQFADIPTVSEWGVVALTLLMLTAATIVMKKRLAAA